jgi:ferredoxin
MSLETFQKRMADNVPGKVYVSDQCLDCDYCRQVAPENFARNDEGGYSYVKKQPETPEEWARCLEAIEGCCTETIFDDGDSFDWAAIPAATPFHLKAQQVQQLEQERKHGCCRKKKEDDDQR